LMVGLVFIIFITNRYVLNDLWKPFYDTLNKLKAFNVSDDQNFLVKNNHVDEFNELNNVVSVMASRVKNDYRHLKLFTENASHEMMTPLAVITSKLDTLIQDETLKPGQYDQINDIYAAANKLSRLNQSLLLLIKIENNLIDDTEPLSLEGLITQKLKQFQELILAKDIHVNVDTAHKQILASKYLIDILLNNFFSNAIRHNNNHGNLIITLNDNKLVFRNSGRPKPLNDQRLFERFQKGKNSEGVGLGLTIAKQICNLYHWELSYSFGNSMHAFQITFS
jgi:signal transduction histidine kinase